MGYIVPHFVHIDVSILYHIKEEHPVVTNEVKTATFYGWKYKHCFVVAVTINFAAEVLYTSCTYFIFAIYLIYVCNYVKVISNLIY